MTLSPEQIAAFVERQKAAAVAQGLPPLVEDEATLARVAAILGYALERAGDQHEAWLGVYRGRATVAVWGWRIPQGDGAYPPYTRATCGLGGMTERPPPRSPAGGTDLAGSVHDGAEPPERIKLWFEDGTIAVGFEADWREACVEEPNG